ncbi:MAG TPA: DUF1697 domain-containing protein [Xanthobacteraceae bacterium]|jgi:uncharacterized protein (DUF1697 family)|nr:DUF1697 domain-containing protein [Xanthobacteraceae bacterium]
MPTRYIALLRAVNVGGTGNLAMADLARLCSDAGFTKVKTYIASGNVVFESRASAATVKSKLEQSLLAHSGKPVGVLIRTVEQIAAVLEANPFRSKETKYTVAIFLDDAPPADTLATAVGRKDEEIRLGQREIYVHYPNGMGRSKLRIPAAKAGTARNMNTIAKLAEMAGDL